MHPVTAVIIGLALFILLMFLPHLSNPCSQFGRHQEQCSKSV